MTTHLLGFYLKECVSVFITVSSTVLMSPHLPSHLAQPHLLLRLPHLFHIYLLLMQTPLKLLDFCSWVDLLLQFWYILQIFLWRVSKIGQVPPGFEAVVPRYIYIWFECPIFLFSNDPVAVAFLFRTVVLLYGCDILFVIITWLPLLKPYGMYPLSGMLGFPIELCLLLLVLTSIYLLLKLSYFLFSFSTILNSGFITNSIDPLSSSFRFLTSSGLISCWVFFMCLILIKFLLLLINVLE